MNNEFMTATVKRSSKSVLQDSRQHRGNSDPFKLLLGLLLSSCLHVSLSLYWGGNTLGLHYHQRLGSLRFPVTLHLLFSEHISDVSFASTAGALLQL